MNPEHISTIIKRVLEHLAEACRDNPDSDIEISR